MGSGASALTPQVIKSIQTEFEKCKKVPSRDYLTLDEIFHLQPPSVIAHLDFTHLGTLFAINSKLDGRFTLTELVQFAEFCDARRKMFPAYEFVVQLQGLCTLRMYEHAVQHGTDALEAWLLRCVYENGPLVCFESHPSNVFIARDSLMPLYKLLKLDVAFGISFPDWFDLVQHAADESSGFDLMDQGFDDVVPESTVQSFLATSLRSFVQHLDQSGCRTALLQTQAMQTKSTAPLK